MERKDILPGWETIRVLGSGGFGKVYEIRKRSNTEDGDFRSALKVISVPQSQEEFYAYRDDGYDDKSITDIFKCQVDKMMSEFALMSKLKGSSNIVSYEDHYVVPHVGYPGWDILIRMELLTPLPDKCNQYDLNDRDVIALGIDICHALELCAEEKIIHRDIKPQNIFVNKFGNYKLGDFGIAKSMDYASKATTKIGTYSFMAPEVYAGKPYNATADIYSLGLVLYWLLNERRLPFMPLPPITPTAAQNSEAHARRFRGERIPEPKHGSAALKSVVLKALQADPTKRYKSAHDMKTALMSINDTTLSGGYTGETSGGFDTAGKGNNPDIGDVKTKAEIEEKPETGKKTAVKAVKTMASRIIVAIVSTIIIATLSTVFSSVRSSNRVWFNDATTTSAYSDKLACDHPSAFRAYNTTQKTWRLLLNEDNTTEEQSTDAETKTIVESVATVRTTKERSTTRKVQNTKYTEKQYSLAIRTMDSGVYDFYGDGNYKASQTVRFTIYLRDGYELGDVYASNYNGSCSQRDVNNGWRGVEFTITMPSNDLVITVYTEKIETTRPTTTKPTTRPTTRATTYAVSTTKPASTMRISEFNVSKESGESGQYKIRIAYYLMSNYFIKDWRVTWYFEGSSNKYWILKCADSCKGEYKQMHNDDVYDFYATEGSTVHFTMEAIDSAGKYVTDEVTVRF